MEANILNKDDVQKLLSAPNNDRDRLLLSLLYETGCTVREISELKIRDFSNGSIHIEGKKSRELKLSAEISEKLSTHVQNKYPELPLLTGRQGALTTKRIRQIVQSYSEIAFGTEINPSVLRYTNFAHSLKHGIAVEKIGKNLGLESQRAKQLFTTYSQPVTSSSYREFLRRM